MRSEIFCGGGFPKNEIWGKKRYWVFRFGWIWVADENQNWYIAALRAGDTKRALTNLRNNGIAYLYPEIKHDGYYRAVLPGYVFVKLWDCDEDFSRVNETQGVSKLLPNHLVRPIAVPQNWMNEFERRLCYGDFEIKVESNDVLPWFDKNEIFGIISGPFTGHKGTFVRKIKGAVEATIAFFGRQLTVELKGHQIQKMM